MTCFKPTQGFRSSRLTKNGKHQFTLSRDSALYVDGVIQRMTIPCRKCEGCRFDYSRMWAVKILHEAQMHGDNNSFITLTYNDEFIPDYGALDYHGDWSSFLGRLRLAIRKISGVNIRYFMVGEYGDKNFRPHYHAIIFGWNFPDKIPLMERLGNVIYRSPLLESCWCRPYTDISLGYSSVGDVSFESAAYVARYNFKKLIGAEFDGFEEYIDELGEVHSRPSPSKRYIRYDPISGDRIVVPSERNFQSNGGGKSKAGGIGKSWFDSFAYSDIYSAFDDGNKLHFKDSFHLSNGIVVRPPKYYDECLKRINPSMLEAIKLQRQDAMSANALEFTPDRLRQRREVLLARLSRKTRNISNIY